MFGGNYFAQAYFAGELIFTPRNLTLLPEPKPGDITDKYSTVDGFTAELLAFLIGLTADRIEEPVSDPTTQVIHGVATGQITNDIADLHGNVSDTLASTHGTSSNKLAPPGGGSVTHIIQNLSGNSASRIAGPAAAPVTNILAQPSGHGVSSLPAPTGGATYDGDP
jgi:hypothetical protein